MDTFTRSAQLLSRHVDNMFVVHQYMASVLGYEACPRIDVYQDQFYPCSQAAPVIEVGYGVYNVTSNQTTGWVYNQVHNGVSWGTKVVAGVVTEYYQTHGEFNGVVHELLTYNPTTHEVDTYSDYQESTLIQYNAATNAPGTSTVFDTDPVLQAGEGNVPSKVKRTMFAWSRMSDGLIIKYIE